MAMMTNKYLTKRQKQYRIARAQTKYKVKYSEKQLKKLFSLKRADTFTKKLSRLAGSIKGAKTTKFLYSPRAKKVLLRQEKKLNKRLEKDPNNKTLLKLKLVNTKRLNRLIEKDPRLSAQEKETIRFRHENLEAQLESAAYHGESVRIQKHGYFIDDFVQSFFSAEYNQWKMDLEEEINQYRANDPEKADELQQKIDNGYQAYFDEELSQYTEPDKQHSGRLVFRKDDIEEILYS